MNYDAWFDYLEIVESDGNMEEIRDVYERAIANIPPSKVSAIFHIFLSSAFVSISNCDAIFI